MATATVEASQRHPKGLYVLFMTEMWERFSYYGMRALLILYLTSQLATGGFELTRENALEIYAIFTGLVYLTPIIGGLLADKLLGQRKAIFIGGILMALGQFLMAYSHSGDMASRHWMLILGLGVIVIGNGFFKPNISTMVGSLYSEQDPRKDSAFTIFYMGINVGATLAPLACGWLAMKFGWAWGFGSAGVGMLIGTLWFYFQGPVLGQVGFPPLKAGHSLDAKKEQRLGSKDWMDVAFFIIGSLVAVYGIVHLWGTISEEVKSTLMIVVGIIAFAALAYVIFTGTNGKTEWSRISVIFILCFFNILFWAGFEQAGGTLNLFAQDNTNRILSFFNGWEFPAAWFQSVNAIWIVVLGVPISLLWLALTKIGKNPNIPIKFAMGLLLLGVGFFIMKMAYVASEGGNLVSPLWLVLVYLLHTIAELCLSPIGLSMITKLSPQKIVSVMMGLWFTSIAAANFVAGMLEGILNKYLPNMHLFDFLTLVPVCGGIILLLISPFLKKLLQGAS